MVESSVENPFAGAAKPPSPAALDAALGRAAPRWHRLLDALAAELAVDVLRWSSWSAKSGWSLRVLRGTRPILYLLPRHGGFEVSLALGEGALARAKAARVSPRAGSALRTAPRCPEGFGVRFPVASEGDLRAVLCLAQAKLER